MSNHSGTPEHSHNKLDSIAEDRLDRKANLAQCSLSEISALNANRGPLPETFPSLTLIDQSRVAKVQTADNHN